MRSPRSWAWRREDVVTALDAIMDPVSLFDPVYSDGGDALCVMDQGAGRKEHR